MIDKVKSTSFKKLDRETWEEMAAQSLRGIPIDNLITQTAENIDIQPLYTLKQLESYSDEEIMSMIHAVRQGKKKTEWTIAQLQYAKTGDQFMDQLNESLERGNEAIVYDGSEPVAWETKHLKQLAKHSTEYPIYATNVRKEDLFLNIFEMIPLQERTHVHGAVSGHSIELPKGFERIRTICADVRDVHHDGADAVTELAIALAKAADKSTSFATFTSFTSQFFVHFSIDTHFFMEIAKLRAFRILWRTFSEAYGENANYSVPIFSETSLRSYSKLDPYVNLLRAGNEAFSAVLGGTDILSIHPHDILTEVTPVSVRIARNTQLVIKHETLINEVIDPAGGSYYVEILTKQLVEKAWKLFLEIDSVGGYSNYVSTGVLEKRLKRLRNYRMEQLTHNEKSLIGTNMYADLTSPFAQSEDAIQIKNRLAKPYEALRGYFTKKQPKIVILTFGKLAKFKPRADFVSSYLAAGGLTCEWSPAFAHVNEAYEWVKDNQFDYGVICASVDEVEAIMNQFVKNMPSSLWIDVAGNYDEKVKKSWIQAGVNGFIYKGQDQIAKLNEIKNKWKGGK